MCSRARILSARLAIGCFPRGILVTGPARLVDARTAFRANGCSRAATASRSVSVAEPALEESRCAWLAGLALPLLPVLHCPQSNLLNRRKINKLVQRIDRNNVITRPMLTMPGDENVQTTATELAWNGSAYACCCSASAPGNAQACDPSILV
ncbi:hypothetical protein MBM_01893 [Drepanopeziza brunnea f. sp. 'multigermtubi' MB_m1]|uniref:Uncharacterized protein n=1 Tax=Marssonina brunnea f. sp. multigermtubi (strain MB_m1) TaxID=1072389 RepID=K1X3Z2_MARBU|nr:uncharacterized protein MBM_01893 [Drepanopeziza brunnea f. sp. 'multigermtubi' MB_m1]EKD19941.1 hypothetical protein MBM_01893 [Drepanopeziza brunnea f. sp. 'multigermtubi' MB_m1]